MSQPNLPLAQLHQAEARVAEKRARLLGTYGEIRHRLKPKTIMTGARDGAERKATDLVDNGVAFARKRPVAAGAILAGLIAWFFREPIVRALRLGFAKLRNRSGQSRVDRTTPRPRRAMTKRSSHDDERGERRPPSAGEREAGPREEQGARNYQRRPSAREPSL